MKVLTEVRDRTLVITINRPQKRNCVDGETANLLASAWKRFRDDDELYVAILTGRFVGAQEAYRIGLANEVVGRGQSLPRCLALAEQLAGLPQGAMRTDKQAALMGYGRPLEEGLRIECEVGQTVLAGHDIREGSSSFVQKRKPSFQQND